MNLPEGLWPVMLTTFNDNKKIDYTALEKLTSFYLEAGSAGLFANCLSSEMFELDRNERISIIKTVVKAAKNTPVVATGTFVSDINANAEFIKEVYDQGVKAVIINSNQLVDADADGNDFKIQLEKLMQETGNIPLGIYECPVPYKRLLSPDLMKWMGESGRFVYHKDTSCDIKDIEKKLLAINNTKLGLFNANVPTALDSIEKGAKGLSPIGANYFPELYSYLFNLLKNPGKKEEAKILNAFLSVIDPLVHNNYPFSAKLFLQQRGFKINTLTRTTYTPLTAQDYIKLKDLNLIFEKLTKDFNITVATWS